jgi:hypothetical protein
MKPKFGTMSDAHGVSEVVVDYLFPATIATAIASVLAAILTKSYDMLTLVAFVGGMSAVVVTRGVRARAGKTLFRFAVLARAFQPMSILCVNTWNGKLSVPDYVRNSLISTFLFVLHTVLSVFWFSICWLAAKVVAWLPMALPIQGLLADYLFRAMTLFFLILGVVISVVYFFSGAQRFIIDIVKGSLRAYPGRPMAR